MANAVIFDIHDKVRALPGSMAARQEIIRLGMTYLDRLAPSASSNPAVRKELAAAYSRLGDVQGDPTGASAGDSDAAMKSYRKGLALLGPPGQDPEAGVLYFDLITQISYILAIRDKAAAVKELALTAALAERLHNDPPSGPALPLTVARSYLRASLVLRGALRTGEAMTYAERAASISRRLMAANPDDLDSVAMLGNSLSVQGTLAARLGEIPRAKVLMEEAVSHQEQVYKRKQEVEMLRSLVLAYGHLGDILGNPGYSNLG